MDKVGFAPQSLEILSLACSGEWTYTEIAQELEIDRRRVAYVLRQYYSFNNEERVNLRNNRIVELWETGSYSLATLSEQFKLEPITTSCIIRRGGSTTRRHQLDIVRKTVIEKYNTGRYSVAQLAREIGIAHNTLGAIVGNRLSNDGTCVQCSAKLPSRKSANTVLCIRCRAKQRILDLHLTSRCQECGIIFVLQRSSAVYKGQGCCSNDCSVLHKRRPSMLKKKHIRDRAMEYQASGRYASSEIANVLSVSFELSANYIRQVLRTTGTPLPPLGWSSDATVLAMNKRATTSTTRTNLILAARSFRASMLPQGEDAD